MEGFSLQRCRPGAPAARRRVHRLLAWRILASLCRRFLLLATPSKGQGRSLLVGVWHAGSVARGHKRPPRRAVGWPSRRIAPVDASRRSPGPKQPSPRSLPADLWPLVRLLPGRQAPGPRVAQQRHHGPAFEWRLQTEHVSLLHLAVRQLQRDGSAAFVRPFGADAQAPLPPLAARQAQQHEDHTHALPRTPLRP